MRSLFQVEGLKAIAFLKFEKTAIAVEDDVPLVEVEVVISWEFSFVFTISRQKNFKKSNNVTDRP